MYEIVRLSREMPLALVVRELEELQLKPSDFALPILQTYWSDCGALLKFIVDLMGV